MSNQAHCVKVLSVKNQSNIADKCIVARSFLSRLKGLIGTRELALGEGLLLRPCNDIHMWFMSMPIDVVFIRKVSGSNSANLYRVMSVRENIQPWKILPVRDLKASETLELPVGTIKRCEILPGDEICIS